MATVPPPVMETPKTAFISMAAALFRPMPRTPAFREISLAAFVKSPTIKFVGYAMKDGLVTFDAAPIKKFPSK